MGAIPGNRLLSSAGAAARAGGFRRSGSRAAAGR